MEKSLKMKTKNYNERFTETEIQIIEDQTRKQMQEIGDPLFLGDKYETNLINER